MPHKTLITGANGYLISNFLSSYASKLDTELYLLDLAFDNIPNDLQYQAIDCKFDSESNIATGFDLIIHAAYFQDLDLERHFIESFESYTKFCLFSSSAVYGEMQGGINTEDSPCQPLNDYGNYKLQVESLVQSKFADHLILRISNPYGKEKNIRGVKAIFEHMLKSRQKIQINADKAEQIIRDFIYIDDFSAALKALLKEEARGIYNISSAQASSLEQLISSLEQQYKQQAQVEYTGLKTDEIQRSILCNQKLRKFYKPQTELIMDAYSCFN